MINSDGVNDERDNCKYEPNPDQLDTDRDGLGDKCDDDIDDDGIPNDDDNCVYRYNPDQADSDGRQPSQVVKVPNSPVICR